MKKIFFLTMASLLVLNACGNLNKEKLGLTRKAPDENLVTPRAPLSLPPEYDASPAQLGQKKLFRAPEASYVRTEKTVAETQKKAAEPAKKQYTTNAMRNSGAASSGLMSAGEQAFVSQVRANQKAYHKQQAEEAVKTVATAPAAKKTAESDLKSLAEAELKAQNEKEQTKAQTVVQTGVSANQVQPAAAAVRTNEVKTQPKTVVVKKYSAPQYKQKASGKRSPLKPLPKTRRQQAQKNGMSAGEQILVDHFENRTYMSDSINYK